jgi:tetratricopeptide (TPR) repeat protein
MIKMPVTSLTPENLKSRRLDSVWMGSKLGAKYLVVSVSIALLLQGVPVAKASVKPGTGLIEAAVIPAAEILIPEVIASQDKVGTAQLADTEIASRLEILRLIDELPAPRSEHGEWVEAAAEEINDELWAGAEGNTELQEEQFAQASGAKKRPSTKPKGKTTSKAKSAKATKPGTSRATSRSATLRRQTGQTSGSSTASRSTVVDRRSAFDEARGREAVARGDFAGAARIFYTLAEREKDPERLLQLRFLLGRTLQELGLHQVAAFPFYEIIRSQGKVNAKNKYVRQALERLTVAADALESDILLRYAVKQIEEEDFPAENRDMLWYRRGELRAAERNHVEAAREFNRVRPTSLLYPRARYRLALALTEAGQLERAQEVFEGLAESSVRGGVTDRNRVNALLGRARVLYQRKMFESSIEAYREVPRDTEQWHEALFETTWANLQDGRFRSALSNFHSLHSPYYEDFFQPESLLLRAIVYHYICRYDEMEKTLGLFERVYGPVQRDLGGVISGNRNPVNVFRELRRIEERFDEYKRQRRRNLQIPFIVARQVLKEGDVRRGFEYVRNLEREKKKIESLPPQWREARVGRYAKRVVERRIESTEVAVGKLAKKHMARLRGELVGHFEQANLIRLDMLSSKKEQVKSEIAGKGIERDADQVDQRQDRAFYIQNGYDYWPFKGEYWLDEIGNYHYVGVKACE